MLDCRPDGDQYAPGILITCTGIPSVQGGYKTPYSATTCGYGTALSAACLGSRVVRGYDATPHLYAGSNAKIEEWNGAGGWTDRSRGGGYSTGSNQWWFTAHGSDIIASNYNDATQVSTGAAFADLTNAPKCRFTISQSRALLACNYRDASGTAIPHGIAISSRGSDTDWTAVPSNDATSVLLTQSEGPILAGCSANDVAVVWKRRSMYTGRFVGGSEKWQFNIIHRHIGCLGQEAWCDTPLGIIFAAEQGVYLFDGSVPRPIDGGMRSYIRGVFDACYNQAQDVFLSHDAKNGIVFVWYRTAITTWSAFSYCYLTDKWTTGTYASNAIGGGSTWTGFECAVRDSNYQDLILLAGSSNTNFIGHLIVSSEHKVTNLAGGATAGLNLSIFTGRVRAQSKAKGLSRVRRILPVWAIGDSSTGELASISSALLYGNMRRGAINGSGTTDTLTLATDKCFDVMRVADNVVLLMVGGDGVFGHITDLEWEIEPAGDK